MDKDNTPQKTRAQIFGENMERIRKQRKMTRKELAQKIGVTEKAISAYAIGKVSPKFENLFALADALHTSTTALTGELVPIIDYDLARAFIKVMDGDVYSREDGRIVVEFYSAKRKSRDRIVFPDDNQFIEFVSEILRIMLKYEIDVQTSIEHYLHDNDSVHSN